MTDFKAILIEQAGVAIGPAKSVEDSLDDKRNNHLILHFPIPASKQRN